MKNKVRMITYLRLLIMQDNKWKIIVLSSYLRRSFIIMIMTLLLNFEKDNFKFVRNRNFEFYGDLYNGIH